MDKITIKSELIINDRHSWRSASTKFAHMNGVSWLGWCTKCGKEAVTGSNIGKCSYYRHTYLDTPVYKYETIDLCSESMIEKAIEKTKTEMLKFYKRYKKYNLPEGFLSGSTSIASQVHSQLLNNKEIIIKDGFYV